MTTRELRGLRHPEERPPGRVSKDAQYQGRRGQTPAAFLLFAQAARKHDRELSCFGGAPALAFLDNCGEDAMTRATAFIAAAAFAALASSALGSSALAEPAVSIRDAAVRVTVIPEDRQDVKVQLVTTNAALPLEVRGELDHVIVEGHLRHRIWGCSTMFGKAMVRVRGVGEVPYGDLPQIVVRTPMNAHVAASSAVFGTVGRSDALALSNAGCGDWTVANVKGRLEINDEGSGDVRGGSAGELAVHVAGSGDIQLHDIRGAASIDVAGSGDVSAASIQGPLHTNVMGSGDVKIDGGRASEMIVHIAGSGDVRFGGVAGTLDATSAGSGDVSVGRVEGAIHKASFGSGGVNIGH